MADPVLDSRLELDDFPLEERKRPLHSPPPHTAASSVGTTIDATFEPHRHASPPHLHPASQESIKVDGSSPSTHTTYAHPTVVHLSPSPPPHIPHPTSQSPTNDDSHRSASGLDVLMKLTRVLTVDPDKEQRAMDGQVSDPMLETLNYDSYEDYLAEQRLNGDKDSKKNDTKMMILRITVTMVIAMLMATTGYFLTSIIEVLHDARAKVVAEAMTNGNAAGGYFIMVSICVAYGLVASFLTSFIAVDARGGGIPYVLAYLNGTNVSLYFSWKTVFVKIVALAFTIASGITLGMEAPSIFIGGALGMLCLQLVDRVPFLRIDPKLVNVVKSIKEERIFVAGGLAAGLAVAFNAPITGIIFVMEGCTAFLTTATNIRIFACACAARFFWTVAVSAFSDKVNNPKLIVISPDLTPPSYAWIFPEVVSFFLLGVFGGLFGSACVWINGKFYRWRHEVLLRPQNRGKRVLDALFWTFLTASLWYVLPYMFGCRDKHTHCDFVGGDTGIYVRCAQLHCPDGQYSEIGSLLFPTIEQLARLLFDRSVKIENHISLDVLMTVGLMYAVLECCVSGLFVPGGLFLPSIIIGAAFGRFWGVVNGISFTSAGINPGVYAMIGAGAMLGGITRLTIPACVLLVEMTGEATYLFPIAIATVTASVLADRLIPPLYTVHMEIERIPVLTDDLEPEVAHLAVKDILKKAASEPHSNEEPSPIVPGPSFEPEPIGPNVDQWDSIYVIDTVKHIISVLYKSKHSLIPVNDINGNFAGLISRRAVIFALKYTPVYESLAEALADQDNLKKVDIFTMEQHMQNWKDTHDYALTLDSGLTKRMSEGFLNLRWCMDPGAMTACKNTPAKRLHAYFRRVGPSHIAVVERSKLLGVITRRNLLGKKTAGHALAAAKKRTLTRKPSLAEVLTEIEMQNPVPYESFRDEPIAGASAAASLSSDLPPNGGSPPSISPIHKSPLMASVSAADAVLLSMNVSALNPPDPSLLSPITRVASHTSLGAPSITAPFDSVSLNMPQSPGSSSRSPGLSARPPLITSIFNVPAEALSPAMASASPRAVQTAPFPLALPTVPPLPSAVIEEGSDAEQSDDSDDDNSPGSDGPSNQQPSFAGRSLLDAFIDPDLEVKETSRSQGGILSHSIASQSTPTLLPSDNFSIPITNFGSPQSAASAAATVTDMHSLSLGPQAMGSPIKPTRKSSAAGIAPDSSSSAALMGHAMSSPMISSIAAAPPPPLMRAESTPNVRANNPFASPFRKAAMSPSMSALTSPAIGPSGTPVLKPGLHPRRLSLFQMVAGRAAAQQSEEELQNPPPDH